jgi:hypothetical protein
LAPFGFVIQSDPQPFDTDFVAELKNQFTENFKESLNTTTKIKLATYTTIMMEDFWCHIFTYLQGKNREIRKCVAKFRTGSHLLEIQQGRVTKPQTEREKKLCKKCKLRVVEDEVHVVFVCPLYETLRVKYSELFRDATNLNSSLNSVQIARYDCYLMHVEFVAET